MPYSFLPSTIRPVGETISLKQSTVHLHYDGFDERYVGSGTMALQSVLQQLKQYERQGSRCEVLLPAYACPDLVSACIGADVTPILVDLAPDTPFPSLEAIKEKLTEHTAAVILVNFLGVSPPKSLFDSIKDLGLACIEDRAQSFVPAQDANQLLGDYVVFSFGKGKPVSLLGGGLALSRSTPITTHSSANPSHDSGNGQLPGDWHQK